MSRKIFGLAVTMLLLCLPGTAQAVVGGEDADSGEFPEMADIFFGEGVGFACGGTLIDPTHVLSAGHCSSLTKPALVSSPAAWPPELIDVRLGSTQWGEGERIPVKQVAISPHYLGLTDRNDISIIELARPAEQTPTKVAGATERSLWEPDDLATITGWGLTDPDDDFSAAETLQKAQVPITTDAYCERAYSDEEGWDFDPETMVCAGYPEGGVDTCQGDSGGPLFGHASDGARRVVGVTSWGDGCAEPGRPGVYARVADEQLREWIRSQVPGGVASEGSTAPVSPDTDGDGVPDSTDACREVSGATANGCPTPTRQPATPTLVGADTTPPALTLRGKRTQRLGKTISVVIWATENVWVAASGSVSVPAANMAVSRTSKVYRLSKIRNRFVARRMPVTLKLRLSKKARNAIRRALRRGKRAKAKIRVTVRDVAGNVTVRTRVIRLKP